MPQILFNLFIKFFKTYYHEIERCFSLSTRPQGHKATRPQVKAVKLILCFSLPLFLLTLFYSCHNENVIFDDSTGVPGKLSAQIVETDSAFYYFRLDNIAADENDFDIEDTTLHVVITDSLPRNGKYVFVINAFKDHEDYIDFGIANGIKLDTVEMIEAHLKQMAIDSGWVAYEDSYDEIPNTFYGYAEDYGESMSVLANTFFAYNPPCGTSGTPILLGGYTPKIPPTYDDNIERFINGPASFYVHHKVYARKWFKTKMFDSWILYGNNICFQGPLAGLANRATSWISTIY